VSGTPQGGLARGIGAGRGAAGEVRRGELSAAQRARIIAAMVLTVGEHGFAGTTISAVCAQARVSRGTFYEAFDGLRECFLAVLDEGYRRAQELIGQAFAGEECWRDGVRAALALLLGSFDEEPLLARVWFVEVLAAGSWALERRERHVRALTAMIVERWPLPDGAQVNPLAAAGVMESLLGIIHTRLLTRREEPLLGLLGPLMGLATAPYLDPQAVAREIERATALAQGAPAHGSSTPGARVGRDPRSSQDDDGGLHRPEYGDGDVQIPRLLGDARARRARDCLRHLAEHPGVSNRQIAAAVGIARDTHISTLLARLHGMGLIVKQARRPGGPNAWTLSPNGREVLQALHTHEEHRPHSEAAASRATQKNAQGTRRKDHFTQSTPDEPM
jgi:AcrR family transcriptional regulator